jgi:aminoglycoside 6'-N-acetyltransferase
MTQNDEGPVLIRQVRSSVLHPVDDPPRALGGQGDLAIRLMRDAMDDYARMAGWLSDERVLEFYEGRDNPFPLERIVEKYSPRTLGLEGVTPCFIVHDGVPIGYIQYYPIDPETAGEYGIPYVEGIYGLDMFIGEPSDWNHGIGTRALSLMCAYLFGTFGARTITLDPEAWNARAIRCYEKCGFRKIKLLPASELHEGQYRDCWIMARQA